MARINCEIPDDVHHAARVAAAQQDISLKEYIIRAMAAANERADPEKTGTPNPPRR